MTIAWVIGGGGLVGTALCRVLRQSGTTLFFPPERFCWGGSDFYSQVAKAVQIFGTHVGGADRWEIYWAAGVGTMSSTEDTLKSETDSLKLVLRLLSDDPQLSLTAGAIAFTSSAGAIYAGSRDAIITENSLAAPTTDYAFEKLKQEGLVKQFAMTHGRINALIARVSTVYGPGQANGKQQGLLTLIARGVLRNRPIQIYVPFDTIRDYITADDAAAAMMRMLRCTDEKANVLVKIIASEQPVTIAEIITLFKRVSRRKPQVVVSTSRLSGLYPRRIQFRSILVSGRYELSVTSLPVGIAQLMMAERASFVRGSVR